MKSALIAGIMTQNPVHDLALPRREKRQAKVIPKNDFAKILAVDTSADMLATMCKVILMTGLRRGEALGLKWEDVDLDNATASIRRAIVATSVGVVNSQTKTEQSERVIPLPSIVVSLLKSLQANKQEFIFTKEDGSLYHPYSVRKGIARLLEKAGLDKVKVHELRHSYATMLLKLGENLKVVQEVLGHSSIQTTANTYSHVSIGMKKQAAAKIDKLCAD
jgi:integrase